MRKNLMILAAMLLACVAVSCNVKEYVIPGEQDEIVLGKIEFKTVTISVSAGDETKTAYEGDKTFSWTPGDQVSVYCTDTANPDGFYTFTTTGSGASAEFTGSIPVTADIADVALFPASASHACSGGVYKFNVDAEKSLVDHDSADIPMYGAKNGSGGFSFTHLTGAFKLTINNVPAGVTKVKVTFTAASSKMSGQFDIQGSGPYTWETAKGANATERSIVRYCNVSENSFVLYIPYTQGTIWGNSSLTVQDYSSGSVGSTLFTKADIDAIPVYRKRVTRLGAMSCEYRSAYGIDWNAVLNTAETSVGAISKMKATMDADYFYVYMEVDPNKLDTEHVHDYDHLFSFYAGTSGDKTSLWSDSSKTTRLLGEVWSRVSGVMDFRHWQGGQIQATLTPYLDGIIIYEVRLDRAFNALISQTSEDVKLGIVIDDNYQDSSRASRGSGNYAVIPAAGEAMYVVPQYVAPVPSEEVATASAVNTTYRESFTETVNPERGMYRHNEYFFKGGSVNKVTVTCEDDLTLALLIIYLEDYMADADLSGAISSIDTILGNVRSAGKKAIVRFAYNNKHHEDDKVTKINPREPENLGIILSHIDALAGIFEDYQDIIYLVQAGFLGTYGEWYYTTDESAYPILFPMDWSLSGDSVVGFYNRNTVLARILAKVPNTIQVALRTPYYKRFYLSPDDVDSWSAISSWDGTDANSRLTFHNDAFLGGADDSGTFKYPYYGKDDPENYTLDKNMWKSQSAYLAIGGEVAFKSLASADPAYYALEPALQAIADYHYSYLNDASSNDEIIQYWVSRDEYPIIRKALGYRLVLNNLSITPAGTYASGQSVSFGIKISNTGSASVIYPRPCKLVLLHGTTPTVLKDLTAVHDVRDITPGGNYTYSIEVVLPQNICEGDKLAIWMPDKTAGLQGTAAYSIRLSNRDVSWENGYNVIHTF